MSRTAVETDPAWTVRCLSPELAPASVTSRAIPASVPGCVHTDLLAAGLIPDPYLDDNEAGQHWIGRSTWLYAGTVELPPVTGQPDLGRRVELVCEGLDTVAEVRMNGIEVGATANQHRRYRFDVTAVARPGRNELEITFTSAWSYAEALAAEQGTLPAAYTAPFNFIRKSACNFGWDWGPVLVTAGIWRPLRVEITDDGHRLGDVRPQATLGADGIAHLVVAPEGAGANDRVSVSVSGPGLAAPVEATGLGRVELDVPGAAAWFPHTLGKQPRYDVHVTLSGGDQQRDSADVRVGFRTVTLDTSPDEIGRRFALAVNGTELFVRGTNWIPDDCFPSRIGPQRYAERVAQAKAAGVNLIRIWGGGIYEDDAFYDACDEAGILVWQDFLFACAAYPEEEPIRSEVLAEAHDNVSRLMPHPSLALWNGNNENIWGHADWGWTESLGDRTWGAGYYFDLLPAIVGEVDPSRPYWPGSPYSGQRDVHPNAMTHGCSHLWEVWNRLDYTHYADDAPRFASEFGFQGPPTWATLTAAVHDEPLTPTSPGMLVHEKAEDGIGKLQRGMSGHLPDVDATTPDGFAAWHYLTQLNQARAVQFGIEHHRSLRGRCMGSIVWQLNDCWPVSSWAALDSGTRADGGHIARRRPLWYALRDAFADRLIARAVDGGLVLVNDSTSPWTGTLSVRTTSLHGAVITERTLGFDVPPGSAQRLDGTFRPAADAVSEVVSSTGERSVLFGGEDIDLALPEPRCTVSVHRDGDALQVAVRADTLLRSLCLFADRVHPDAEADTMIIDLLPGQQHTFTITGPAGWADGVAPEIWAAAPVLRCVNQLTTAPEPASTVAASAS